MSVGRFGGVRGEDFEVPVSEEAGTAALDRSGAGQAAPARPGLPSGRPSVHAAAVDAPGADVDGGKLLTKKMAGERALLHHLAGRVGPKFEAKVIPGPDREHYLVKLHRRSPAPPFDTDANPEATYSVDRRDGKITRVDAAPPEAAPVATAGSKSLGELARPGKTLRDTTQALKPGETLRFTTRENQIFGVGEIRVEPRGALDVKRKLLEPASPGRLGGTSLYEYRFTVPPGARAGENVKVTTGGHFQVRNDPDWAFSFKVHVAGIKS